MRLFGAQIGREVHIYNSATIYMPWNLCVKDWASIGEHVYIYNLGHVTIGERATISHKSHICAGTHDYCKPDLPLLKPPVSIEDQTWICAQSFIGPGVTVGAGAVVGAGSVVVKDVKPWTVVAGNPACYLKDRTWSEV